jgi:hypothetical protein
MRRKEYLMTTKVESRVGGNGKPAGEPDPIEQLPGTEEPIEEAAHGFLSVAGVVRAEKITLRNAFVGGIAGESVSLERGMVRGAIAGRELRLHQAGAGMIISGGTTELQQAGAQAVISAGSVRMQQAGSGLALAQEIEVGDQGMVVFGLTPRLEVREGGRVMFGPATSLAVLGALASLVTALAVFVARRRRTGDTAP